MYFVNRVSFDNTLVLSSTVSIQYNIRLDSAGKNLSQSFTKQCDIVKVNKSIRFLLVIYILHPHIVLIFHKYANYTLNENYLRVL